MNEVFRPQPDFDVKVLYNHFTAFYDQKESC